MINRQKGVVSEAIEVFELSGIDQQKWILRIFLYFYIALNSNARNGQKANWYVPTDVQTNRQRLLCHRVGFGLHFPILKLVLC